MVSTRSLYHPARIWPFFVAVKASFSRLESSGKMSAISDLPSVLKESTITDVLVVKVPPLASDLTLTE